MNNTKSRVKTFIVYSFEILQMLVALAISVAWWYVVYTFNLYPDYNGQFNFKWMAGSTVSWLLVPVIIFIIILDYIYLRTIKTRAPFLQKYGFLGNSFVQKRLGK